MSETRLLLAILGRGIQRVKPNWPWNLTEDMEVCDEKFSHLPVRASQNDNDDHSIVGGGQLNLLAGLELEKILMGSGLEVVVHAYGFRSKYLKSMNAPSESMVMGKMYCDYGGRPGIVQVFDEHAWEHVANRPSNTNQEIENIFCEALKRGIHNVAIVTVAVHAWRSNLMAQRHISDPEKNYGLIKLKFFTSENVLMEADPVKYNERCRALLGSKSFLRNLQLEQNGVNALLSGTYQSVQSTTQTSKA